MGQGIAIAALQANFPVILCDVQADMLAHAHREVERRLRRWAEKTGVSTADVDGRLAGFAWGTDLAALASVALVIEAVPERIDLKRDLFRRLDEICTPDAILATNTSSLSVTVIAAATRRPARVVGLHFFNPAPVMELVEIVCGADTSPEVVDQATAWARALGKHPTVCRDTPGFIVNRVARNFYGEALRIADEGTASTDRIDALMQHGAGFRMGPFELMDFIGIDVNYAVTQAVYDAFHGEPRYRPHGWQSRLVASGHLGRKSGRGFYTYDATGTRSPVGPLQTATAGARTLGEGAGSVNLADVAVVGNTPLAQWLRQRVAAAVGRPESACGVVFDGPWVVRDTGLLRQRLHVLQGHAGVRRARLVLVSLAGDVDVQRSLLQGVEAAVHDDTWLCVSLAGPSATEQASWLRQAQRVRGYGVTVPVGSGAAGARLAEWSCPVQARDANETVAELPETVLHQLGFDTVLIRDGAGGVLARILSMVLNEAVEVVRSGVAKSDEVDVAMRLGTNYPQGPLAWLRELGVASVWTTLNALMRDLGEDRYRPSPALKYALLAETNGIEWS